MKKCEYCGDKVADDVLICNNCGAKEFKNICVNCETAFNGNRCSACGVMIGDNPRTCFNCAKKTFEKVCPDCGADLIYRKKVQVNHYPISKPIQKKKSSLPVVMVLLIIIIGIIAASNLNKESTNLSYVELLTLNDHPMLFEDYSEAKKFWKKYDEVKVVKPNQANYHEDALLVVTCDGDNNDFITKVIINLSNVEKKQELELDDVLRLICDYIPFDVIDKYYTFAESFHETSKSGRYEAYHYVMNLNNEGNAVNQSGERYFTKKFAFKIIHRNNKDWIADMQYLSYEGNFYGYSFNPDKYDVKYWDVEYWDVDINKYNNTD